MNPKARFPGRDSHRCLVAMLAVAALLGQSCTDRIPTAGAQDPVPVRITVFAVGTPISTLVVEVTATDFRSPLVFNLTVQMGVASGTIRIPPGMARTIRVTAFDDEGNVTHEGSVTIDVRPGPNPPVDLPLTPRAGQVPIVVTFGNFSVVVQPAEATIDAGIANQLQLTVSVTGADGQPVAEPQVAWATTMPTFASVSTSGLVTGLANGPVTIVAAFEGVAGLSAISVKGVGDQGSCGGGQLQHSNGLGQSYFDCNPLGVPGNSSTYNISMATAAAEAWVQAATQSTQTLFCGSTSVGARVASGTAGTAVWVYTTLHAGRVRLFPPGETVLCPDEGWLTWN